MIKIIWKNYGATIKLHGRCGNASTILAKKKVFITGHTGFKGSWLSLWLQCLGADVRGYALPPPTTPNLFTLADIGKHMESIEGDVRDFEHLNSALKTFEPDIIFHLAAQPLVRHSYQFPIETYATNVMGTVHLLEAARSLTNCQAIVNITSDKCYDNQEWCWSYRENDALGGYDPYSNSKACAELVSSAFRSSFYHGESSCGLATARAGNVIGGGDWAKDRLIPDCIQSILQGKDIILRNPQALRPWQHVLEPLHGYLLLAEALYQFPAQFAAAWNFGPEDNDVKPVQWVVEKAIELTNSSSVWNLNGEAKQPHEANYLKLDSSKSKTNLNWLPQWTIERALQETASWYLAHHHGDDMRDCSIYQINSYHKNLQDA